MSDVSWILHRKLVDNPKRKQFREKKENMDTAVKSKKSQRPQHEFNLTSPHAILIQEEGDVEVRANNDSVYM